VPSHLEDALMLQILAAGLPEPEREVRFARPRRFRFDFLFLGQIAVEVEGGVFSGGRHTRGTGFEADCVKYNLAAEMGFTVLRFTGEMIETGAAIDTIRRVIEQRRD
jgi:very-short-patch-repair endonuclease